MIVKVSGMVMLAINTPSKTFFPGNLYRPRAYPAAEVHNNTIITAQTVTIIVFKKYWLKFALFQERIKFSKVGFSGNIFRPLPQNSSCVLKEAVIIQINGYTQINAKTVKIMYRIVLTAVRLTLVFNLVSLL